MFPGALVQVVVWSSEPGVPVDEKLVDVRPPLLLSTILKLEQRQLELYYLSWQASLWQS